MNILIHPYAARLHNGAPNPKNFPWWADVVAQLNELGYEVVQIGIKGEDRVEGVGQFIVGWPLQRLRHVVDDCATFISVDSFLPHFTHVECGRKRGVVIWSQSDPLIWGHPENINLLKDRNSLAANQFLWWEATEHNPDTFVKPEEILPHINDVESMKTI